MKRYTMEIQFDTSNDISSAITIAKEDPNGEFTGATDALRLKDTLEMAYRCIASTAHYDHMKYAQDVRNQIKKLMDELEGEDTSD